MRITKTLDVELTEEEIERLTDGNPLQIPIDPDQGLVLYPPDYNHRNSAEAGGEQ
jgi:hypothetical protein